jgi:predicted nucleic acid-binding protein
LLPDPRGPRRPRATLEDPDARVCAPHAVAERYGEILAVARSQRRTAKATDLLIIATAAAHDRTLHTHDQRQAELARAAGIPVQTI